MQANQDTTTEQINQTNPGILHTIIAEQDSDGALVGIKAQWVSVNKHKQGHIDNVNTDLAYVISGVVR